MRSIWKVYTDISKEAANCLTDMHGRTQWHIVFFVRVLVCGESKPVTPWTWNGSWNSNNSNKMNEQTIECTTLPTWPTATLFVFNSNSRFVCHYNSTHIHRQNRMTIIDKKVQTFCDGKRPQRIIEFNVLPFLVFLFALTTRQYSVHKNGDRLNWIKYMPEFCANNGKIWSHFFPIVHLIRLTHGQYLNVFIDITKLSDCVMFVNIQFIL